MADYATKFSIGEKVWGVSEDRFDQIVRCKPCGNTGKIVIGDETLICPKCNGRSTHTQYAGKMYYISEFGAIVGQVRVEHTGSEYDYRRDEEKPEIEITYMLTSTGVRAGQVRSEGKLFASEGQAKTFCEFKNGLLPPNECEHGQPVVDFYGKVIKG